MRTAREAQTLCVIHSPVGERVPAFRVLNPSLSVTIKICNTARNYGPWCCKKCVARMIRVGEGDSPHGKYMYKEYVDVAAFHQRYWSTSEMCITLHLGVSVGAQSQYTIGCHKVHCANNRILQLCPLFGSSGLFTRNATTNGGMGR